MASVYASEALHAFTVEDYHRMHEVGIFTDRDPVELLDGLLVAVVGEGPRHAEVVSRLARFYIGNLLDRDDLRVRVGAPVTLPPHSEPQPDLAVVEAASATFEHHPPTAHLAIEVSFSSIGIDLIRKARIYARAGLPEYWVIDLVQGRAVIHRDPVGDHYEDVTFVAPGALLVPLAVPAPPLDLAALLTP